MTFPGPGPASTGLGVPAFVTERSAPAQKAPDCVPGVCVIDKPEIVTPGWPIVAPYASSAKVVTPGLPPATFVPARAAELRITPPPPPAPGPCRLPGNAPGVCSGQVV